MQDPSRFQKPFLLPPTAFPQAPVTLHVLEGHTDFVCCLAFSPHGQWLASASQDGEIRLWGFAQ